MCYNIFKKVIALYSATNISEIAFFQNFIFDQIFPQFGKKKKKKRHNLTILL